MKTTPIKRCGAVLIFLAATGACESAAQRAQGALAASLRGTNRRDVAEALNELGAIRPDERSPELRAALRAALQTELGSLRDRTRRGALGATPQEREFPELAHPLVRAVVEARDPADIPVLARSVGTGAHARNALLAFGPATLPEIVGVVVDPESTAEERTGGLIVLRQMVDEVGLHNLSRQELSLTRDAAIEGLEGVEGEALLPLWRAIDLASVLEDPGLNAVLEGLATDASAVRRLGVSDDAVIELTMTRAADRLAGVPALPR